MPNLPPVKIVPLLLLLASPTRAELLANVQTSLGTVVVDLQYQKAPQAVANFITMAQATRSRLDPNTGAVIRSPLYIGEKFFRVLNGPGFRIAQTGSGTGTNGGGPGFTSKDEFHATLSHIPYVLSMANSGPNTNGSQIFFTGNDSIPSLDNVHTVFGFITDPASRTVIDAILTAGDNGSTITAVSFSRTDAAATDFNEHAQNLPEITQPGGNLTVTPNLSTVWNFAEALSTGAIFRGFRSTTLVAGSWLELPAVRRHVGNPMSSVVPAITTATLDNASAARGFYNLSVARHPGAVTPSSLGNRKVRIPLGSNTLSYVFDSSGVAGVTTYTPSSGSPIIGPFTTVNPNNGLPLAPSTDSHSLIFTADTPVLSPRYLWVKLGCDSLIGSEISGHHSTQSYNGTWQPFTSGAAFITVVAP